MHELQDLSLMAITKGQELTIIGRDVGKKGTLIHLGWDYKLIQPLSKTVQRVLKILKNKTTI
jgi:hypothetical protein